MAKRGKAKSSVNNKIDPVKKEFSNGVEAYRHEADKRKNAVPVGLASYDTAKPKPKKYEYDPHLDPQLVWAGKAERTSFEVPTVSLHIHENIAPEAIIRSVKRETPQPDLFAKPDMPLKDLVEFYQHDMDWTNRLILGDSLLVMNSMLEREMMSGKVQCIFFDPPYGVKFSSNFQPSVKQRDVKDSDEFMVREPEQIKAYRDTWELGIHSYLSYLRDRLLLSRDLLTDSGSIFVQISDENVHHVRELMDEVFGKENFVNIITFTKTRSLVSSDALTTIADFILWHAKNKEQLKIRKIFKSGFNPDLISHYEDGKGNMYTKTEGEKILQENPNVNLKPFMSDNLIRAFNPEVEFEFQGKTYRGQYRTNLEGMKNLAAANRLFVSGKQLRYKFFLSDYPISTLNTIWDDVIGATDKVYVVQTNVKVVERCILMTTDPGDLVFDPTCGTTAYVAEQWGRRWITCDTSRVALTLARQRLMTAVYPYYKLADVEMGVKGGFIYEEVPHITLKSIANNEPPDKEILFDKPEVDRKRVRVAGPFTVEGIPQHSTLDFEDANYETEVEAIEDNAPSAPPLKIRGGRGSYDSEFQIILKGVDIYDPLTGEVYSDNGSKIAAWFIDTDYDKRTFCVSQAFFPDSTPWDKLKRALKASIDEDKFELLTSTCSLPFKLGKEERIAVKVIDHRGNEVMVVREIK
jgi:adenine-specific DNA-methyltransferase